MKISSVALIACICLAEAFQQPTTVGSSNQHNNKNETFLKAVSIDQDAKKSDPKQALLGLIGDREYIDPVLADPDTKEPLRVATSGVFLGGQAGPRRAKFNLQSTSSTFQGTSDTFLNLLEAVKPTGTATESDNATGNPFLKQVAKQVMPFIPPPLRSPLASAGFPVGDDYVPMRDLFTSPQVSFAYERGWRQGFASAGFPGPDKEAEMAMEYFATPIANAKGSNVLVDMSCATGESEGNEMVRKCRSSSYFTYLLFIFAQRLIYSAVCQEWKIRPCHWLRLFGIHVGRSQETDQCRSYPISQSSKDPIRFGAL